MQSMLPPQIIGEDCWHIGATLRERRKRLGWSMAELARRMDGAINARRIGRIERGQCEPGWYEILPMLEVLGVGFDLVPVGV